MKEHIYSLWCTVKMYSSLKQINLNIPFLKFCPGALNVFLKMYFYKCFNWSRQAISNYMGGKINSKHSPQNLKLLFTI